MSQSQGRKSVNRMMLDNLSGMESVPLVDKPVDMEWGRKEVIGESNSIKGVHHPSLFLPLHISLCIRAIF